MVTIRLLCRRPPRLPSPVYLSHASGSLSRASGSPHLALILVAVLLAWAPPSSAAVETLSVRVHRVIPHQTDAFTQGLVWWNGKLYESTGRRGHSELRRIDPANGAVEQRAAIPVFFFGEGLALVQRRLVMLTWQAERAFVFDVETFERLPPLSYRGEGWGLCHDGQRFVMSDGSSELAFRHSDSFTTLGSVDVTMDGQPLAALNELECVAGSVYANVFQRDLIVRIDPASGVVTQRIDAGGLLNESEARAADVLNGIAFNPDTGRFFITGKLWPKMFEATFQ